MTELVRYDAMCGAIAAAYEVDEVKDIRDHALALELYARQAHNVEAERQACEIRLRAERKAGKLSAELEKSAGGRPSKTPPTVGTVTKAGALRDAGISKKQSEQWEKLAAVPDEAFEAALSDRTQVPTTNGIIRAAAEPKVERVSQAALWLWGALRDFERNQGMYSGEPMLSRAQHDVLETMTAEMKDDVHRLAPRVAAWLSRIGEMPCRKKEAD